MKRNSVKVSSIVCGLLIVAAGVLLFAFNAGLLLPEYKSVVFSWQMLLVAIGFVLLFSRHKWTGGVIMMLIGGFFLLPKLNIEGLAFITQNVWAIVLIVVGLLVMCKTICVRHIRCHFKCFGTNSERNNGWRSHWRNNRHNMESGYVIHDCVFKNVNEKVYEKNFKGGDIDSVFSNIELDLSEAQLVEGVNHLKIDTVFGYVVIYAPAEWNIEIREDSVFGGFVDKRPKPEVEIDRNKLLIIHADSVFSSGEIRGK